MRINSRLLRDYAKTGSSHNDDDLTRKAKMGTWSRRPALLKLLVVACICMASILITSTEAASVRPRHNEDPSGLLDSKIDLLRYLWEVRRLREQINRAVVTTPPSPYKRAGSNCLFHAGLAHNCDYRDVIASVNEMSHWGSELAPGKRRRRRKRSTTDDNHK